MVDIISRRHLPTKIQLLTFLVMIPMIPQRPLLAIGLPWAVPAVLLPDPVFFNDQQQSTFSTPSPIPWVRGFSLRRI